jgi:hypothetical protein
LEACFVVREKNDQQLAYASISRRSPAVAAKLLSKDEARRIASNIAKLPELLQEPRFE